MPVAYRSRPGATRLTWLELPAATLVWAMALSPALAASVAKPTAAASSPAAGTAVSGAATSPAHTSASAPTDNTSAPLSPRLKIVSPEAGAAEPAATGPAAENEEATSADGERLRLWTQITEAESKAADPSFRRWVELIREGRGDSRVMRLYWYYRSRLDPFDKLVPFDWRSKGVDALRAERFPPPASETTSRDAPSAATTAAGISRSGVWVPIGPYTIPGRMTGLAKPEKESNTLYAAAADGGLWRTRDLGASWESLTDFEETLSGGAVLLDPTNSNVIYFGTGEGNGAIDNYGGVGVLKSTDGGRTWTRSNLFSGSIRGLAMHRSNPSRIYAAGDYGCYVSNDSGATFSLMSGGLPTTNGASAVVVRPDDPAIVYCAIWGGSDGGIYRTMDGGTSWSLLTNGLPAKGTVGRISLAISASNPDELIAGIERNNGRVYKTVDRGDSWSLLTGGSGGYCGGQCWYDNSVGIDATDPNVFYIGGVGASRSLDGGASWSGIGGGGNHGTPNYVHVDHHAIFSGQAGEVILANDGGIYRSTDYGSFFNELSQGMDTTQYYGICNHPSDTEWAFGGTQDNGSHRRRLSDNPPWTQVLGGDGGMCMTGPPSGSVILGEYQNHNMQRSADGGGSWTDANGGIFSGDPQPWVGLLVSDPSNRANMWTTTNRVYRSRNARSTNWISASSPLYFFLSATAIEVAPSNGNVVYAGFDAGGLFVSINALASDITWSDIRQSYLPQRGVRRIRALPSSADTLYVIFGGYGSGKIWKSANRGSSYSDVTGDLPDIPVNDLVIDSDNPGTLIAATDLGVFRSEDDGAHWFGWSMGLPTVSSIELTYDRSARKLRLGTHGRSVWQWQESSSAPTAVPDGSHVAGTAMKSEPIGSTQMRVRWDTRSCTARDYNLFFGDLAAVASLTYLGADCGLGTSGIATVALPSTPSGSAFFIVASTDGSGKEGPHGFDSNGAPRAASGAGYCGITSQVTSASCP